MADRGLGQRPGQGAQLAGVDRHVGVHEGHQVASGLGHAGPDGRALAGVGPQVQHPGLLEAVGQAERPVGRPVGAPVVHHDHLDLPVGHGRGQHLGQSVQPLGQPLGLVVGRDDERQIEGPSPPDRSLAVVVGRWPIVVNRWHVQICSPRPWSVGASGGGRHRGPGRPRPAQGPTTCPDFRRVTPKSRHPRRSNGRGSGPGCPDQAGRKDGGVGDRRTGEGGLDDGLGTVGPRAGVHHHVVDDAVTVEVEIEQQVTGLEGVQRDVGQTGVLGGRRAGDAHSGLGPGPHGQPGAVES